MLSGASLGWVRGSAAALRRHAQFDRLAGVTSTDWRRCPIDVATEDLTARWRLDRSAGRSDPSPVPKFRRRRGAETRTPIGTDCVRRNLAWLGGHSTSSRSVASVHSVILCRPGTIEIDLRCDADALLFRRSTELRVIAMNRR